MARYLIFAFVIWIIGCSSQKTASSSNKARGDTRTKPVLMLDDNTYLLTETTADQTYAYRQSNPVKVGGSKDSSGPKNERRFLNALQGPAGEVVRYFRTGSCCPFKTPHGILDNTGLLDHYRLFWTGGKDTLDIYLNMYDEGDLFIPVGLTAKKKN